MKNKKSLKISNRIIGIVGTILFILLLWYVRTLVFYFMVSAVLAIIGRPVLKLLEKIHFKKWKFPNFLNVIVTMSIFIFLAFGFFSWIIPMIGAEVDRIGDIDIQRLVANSENTLSQFRSHLDKYNLNSEILSTNNIYAYINELFEAISFSSFANSLLATFGNLFIAAFSIIFISFFLLKERLILHNIIFTLTPDSKTEKMGNILENTKRLLSRYFVGLFIQVTVIATLVSIGLTIVGVENAILLGCLAGLFNLVPYIGPMAGASVAILFTLILNLDMDFNHFVLPLLIKVASVFAVIQLLDNFVFQPIIFSKSVFAHPLEIFLVISIAGNIAGIVGMFLAIPLYTFVRIIAKEFLSEFKVVQTLTKKI